MIDAGIDARAVADVLGHSQPSTTSNTYAHSFAQRRAQAVTKIDERLAEAREKRRNSKT
jgi:integrase